MLEFRNHENIMVQGLKFRVSGLADQLGLHIADESSRHGAWYICCRANMAHIRQSRPGSGVGFWIKVSATFSVFRFPLGSGCKVSRCRGTHPVPNSYGAVPHSYHTHTKPAHARTQPGRNPYSPYAHVHSGLFACIVSRSWFRVKGSWYWIESFGFRVQDQGLGFGYPAGSRRSRRV